MQGIVINLNEYPRECQICFQIKWLTHCVAYCCEPTYDEIGSKSTVYRDCEVGGMICCKECHDKHEAGRPSAD